MPKTRNYRKIDGVFIQQLLLGVSYCKVILAMNKRKNSAEVNFSTQFCDCDVYLVHL